MTHPCWLCGEDIDADQLDLHISMQHFNVVPFRCEKCAFTCPTSALLRNHFVATAHGDALQSIEPPECPLLLSNLIRLISAASQSDSVEKMLEILEKAEMTSASTPPEELPLNSVSIANRSGGISSNLRSSNRLKSTAKSEKRSIVAGIAVNFADSSDVSKTYSTEDVHNYLPYTGAYKNELRRELVKGQSVWSCQRCRKSFRRQRTAIIHVQSHMPPLFACDLCDRRFGYAHTLRFHLSRQHGVISEQGKGLKTVNNNDIVKRVEPKVTEKSTVKRRLFQFRCAQCGKSFATISLLNQHSCVLADPRYSYSQCDANYARPESLRLHKRMKHSGPVLRKHKCVRCGKAFGNRSALVKHAFVHNNTKFGCNLCEAKYQHSRDLLTHQRRKHPGTNEEMPMISDTHKTSGSVMPNTHA